MKKIKYFGLMGAIALTSAIGFTACSSDDSATADVNPTYDGTSVRTDFAFSITKASQTTRMSADNTQNNNNFLGMEHMYLLPFTGEPNATTATTNQTTNLNTSESAKIHNYALGTLANTEITTTNSKKIYSLTLPIGTDNFLFYGKATRGSKTAFQAGRLSSSFFNADNTVVSETGTQGASSVANIDNIEFKLVGIATSLGDEEAKIIGYLNQIAQTTDWAECVDIVANPANHTDIANPGAYSSLADLYTKFTTITTDRCGSAEAIERTILDLFKSARAINAASSVAAVQTIANAICNNIDKKYNDVRVTVSATNSDPENWTASFAGINRTFPANHDLPMGAAQLTYDKTSKEFSYKTAVSPGSTVVTSGASLTDICYPAELVYYDNSPLRATDKYKTVSDYPSTPADWDLYGGTTAGLFNEDWSGNHVASTTRAVAMQNNVNYGVALLKTTVYLESENLTDNMKSILGGTATNQTNIPGTGMQVTGILIGGQPGTIGWQMVNKATTGFDKVIYDNDAQYGAALSTLKSDPNYTIVLDNLTSSDVQANVNIALQIKNGNQDFYGKNGLIPKGHTFYLVGTLDLTAVASGNGRTTPNVVRTYGETGVARSNPDSGYRIWGEGTDHVFMQDYQTVANIKISTNALQSAYSCIPDLRSTEVLFGLSVDLKWETGITFEVEM